MDVLERNPHPEGEARQDGGLGGGVGAGDVSGRIGLGVSQALGLSQGLAVGGGLSRHLGEDVVGGAVDDSHHRGDALTRQ